MMCRRQPYRQTILASYQLLRFLRAALTAKQCFWRDPGEARSWDEGTDHVNGDRRRPDFPRDDNDLGGHQRSNRSDGEPPPKRSP